MATKSPLKKVNTRTTIWPLEDGRTESRPVTLWLDPRRDTSFVIKLPDYVAKNLGIASEVSAPLAEGAWKLFADVTRKYVDWYRTAKAEPVIILRVQFYGSDEDGRHIEEDNPFFGGMRGEWKRKVCVGVKYQLAFRVNGRIHHRDEDDRDDNKIVHKVGGVMAHGADGEVLDYTPEIHERIDLICAAVNKAAQQLHALIKAKDITKTLLSTNFGALPAPKEKQ